MKLRERIYRLLFGAEYEQSQQRYQDYCAEHVLRQELEGKNRGLNEASRVLWDRYEKLLPKPPRFDRYRPYTEDQLAEILAGTEDLPIVKAIMQMIDEKFQQAGDAASEANLDPAVTKFHLGGGDWLVRLKGELQSALEQERAKEKAS